MSRNENNNSEAEVRESMLPFYPSDLWKGFRKFWWVSALLAIIFGSLQFYKSYVRFTPVYSTSATFTVTTQSTAISEGGFSSYSFYYDTTVATQLATTFPYIMSSTLLYDAICEDLNLVGVPARLSASSVTGSNMFTLIATGTDPQMTYDILNSAIKNYPVVAKYIVGNLQLSLITEPYVPQTPTNASEYKNTTMRGAVTGFLLGLLVVILYALIRKTIRTKDDIKKELRTEVLGTLPLVTFKKYRKQIDTTVLSTNERVGNGFLESLRVTRNTLVNSLDKEDKVILVTSTAPGEGKTTTCVNLAMSLSNLGNKVLLIDCDLRNPSVLPLLQPKDDEKKVEKSTNLYDIHYLRQFGISEMSFKEEDKRYWNIMRSNLIKEIIDSVRDSYDYILVDTPPCGLVSDALVVAQAANCAVYVILQDTVMVSKIISGMGGLMETDVKVKGCILNGAMSGLSGYGNNYGYGYGYGYGYRAYGRYGYGKYGYGKYGYGYGYGEEKKKRRRSN